MNSDKRWKKSGKSIADITTFCPNCLTEMVKSLRNNTKAEYWYKCPECGHWEKPLTGKQKEEKGGALSGRIEINNDYNARNGNHKDSSDKNLYY
jgi:predicted RNA-binding Zn-ribbon protein involved in translation (DUF1610 family)